jgi:hypothetical protein
VTATWYPASAIFVLMVPPRPPMPPVINANRFAMVSSFGDLLIFRRFACEVDAQCKNKSPAPRRGRF